jgi:hypothetical protein
MRAQQAAIGEIERIVHRPRRMIRGDVERLEVVPVVFDLRAVGDCEPGIAEDLLDAPARARDRMQAAKRLATAGQRHIDGIARELRREFLGFERRAPRVERLRERVLRFVDLRAGGATRFRIHRAQRLEQRGDLALLAEQPHADLLEILDARGLGDFAADGVGERLQVLTFGHERIHQRWPDWAPLARRPVQQPSQAARR